MWLLKKIETVSVSVADDYFKTFAIKQNTKKNSFLPPPVYSEQVSHVQKSLYATSYQKFLKSKFKWVYFADSGFLITPPRSPDLFL